MKTSWIDWSSFQLHRMFVLYRSKVHLPVGSFCFWFLAWRCSGNLAIHQHRNYSLPTSGQGRSWVQNKLWHEMMYMDHMDASCEAMWMLRLRLAILLNITNKWIVNAKRTYQSNCIMWQYVTYHTNYTVANSTPQMEQSFLRPMSARLHQCLPLSKRIHMRNIAKLSHSHHQPSHKKLRTRIQGIHVQCTSITASLCLHQHKHGQGYQSESSPLETHGQMHAVHVFGNSWSSLCTFTTFSRQTFLHAVLVPRKD